MAEPKDGGQEGGGTPPTGPGPGTPPAPEISCVPRDRLRERFGDAVLEAVEGAGQVTVRVAPAEVGQVLGFLRDDPACRMDLLVDQCGADYPERPERFEVIYHLYSIPHRHFLRVKVQVVEGGEVPSATAIWSTADWFEREIYDLLGIGFTGHPDLRRILLPDGWRGHPLRKEYPLAGYPDQHLRLR